MKRILILFFAASIIQMFSSCRPRVSEEAEQVPVVSVKTTAVARGNIENILSLNGKTIYLRKNTVVSPISGYVVKSNISFGETVQKNDVLFELQTRESKALDDPGATGINTGTVKVTAPAGGMINELIINETGGYIVEGGAMCSIVETGDFFIQMNVPFQYNALLKKGMKCRMTLSDNTAMDGYVYKVLPVINETSQTQNVLIKPAQNRPLPENLNMIVQLVIEKHTGILLVDKDAVMANETQSEFWVMKIADNNLALKVPVTKGIENDSTVEVFSPLLNLNDLLISDGAFGMADSTEVKIEK
ncbi:MAG TPA: HlyD family efflux transporter periplasmic adaptor subunit [Bacteroidales bacterium]|nr:HlyD family efflux transporter periplasmic adaptor subunit [Bacteroidales bacterium]